MFAINTTGIPPIRENEDCEPTGEINYWRVRPLDRPFTKRGDMPGVQGLFSETQAFLYMPAQITNMAPRGGADGRRPHAEVGHRRRRRDLRRSRS